MHGRVPTRGCGGGGNETEKPEPGPGTTKVSSAGSDPERHGPFEMWLQCLGTAGVALEVQACHMVTALGSFGKMQSSRLRQQQAGSLKGIWLHQVKNPVSMLI